MFNDVIQTKDQGFIALGKTNSRSIRNNWTGLSLRKIANVLNITLGKVQRCLNK